jgi:hypothetical protein
MQMGVLFGVPTDATLDPAFIQSQQALYANPPPEQSPIQEKAPGALAGIELHDVEDEKTETERLEGGAER